MKLLRTLLFHVDGQISYMFELNIKTSFQDPYENNYNLKKETEYVKQYKLNKQGTKITSWTAVEFNSHGDVSVPSFGQKTDKPGASNWEKSVLLDSVSVTVSSEILIK